MATLATWYRFNCYQWHFCLCCVVTVKTLLCVYRSRSCLSSFYLHRTTVMLASLTTTIDNNRWPPSSLPSLQSQLFKTQAWLVSLLIIIYKYIDILVVVFLKLLLNFLMLIDTNFVVILRTIDVFFSFIL